MAPEMLKKTKISNLSLATSIGPQALFFTEWVIKLLTISNFWDKKATVWYFFGACATITLDVQIILFFRYLLLGFEILHIIYDAYFQYKTLAFNHQKVIKTPIVPALIIDILIKKENSLEKNERFDNLFAAANAGICRMCFRCRE